MCCRSRGASSLHSRVAFEGAGCRLALSPHHRVGCAPPPLQLQVRCIQIAIDNPASKGEMRVFNQFTEMFRCADLWLFTRNSSAGYVVAGRCVICAVACVPSASVLSRALCVLCHAAA